jgi:hypothetical protein
VNWTLNGNGVLVENGINSSFIAYNSTGFSISAEIVTPLGVRTDIFHPTFYNIVSSLEITGFESNLLLGREAVFGCDIGFASGLSDVDHSVDWSLSGNVTDVIVGETSIMFKPLEKGKLTITCSVSILNETYVVSRDVNVLSDIFEIMMDPIPDHILVGDYLNLSFHVLDLEGDLFESDFNAFVTTGNTSILFPSMTGSNISLLGLFESDNVSFILNVTYRDRSILFVGSIDIISVPSRVSIEVPSVLFNNKITEYPLIVFDHNDKVMEEFEIEIRSLSVEATYMNGNLSLRPNGVGDHVVQIIVDKHGHSFSYDLNLTIIANATGILTPSSPIHLFIGEKYFPKIKLMDDNNEEILWTDWIVETDDSIEILFIDDVFPLIPSKEGSFDVVISTIYYGIEFSSTMLLEVDERVYLADIKLILHDPEHLQVYAYDQNGDDITYICLITWSGEFDPLTDDSVDPVEGTISVEVVYNGTILSESLDVGISARDRFDTNKLLVLFSVFVLLLMIFAIVFLYIKSRSRTYSEE